MTIIFIIAAFLAGALACRWWYSHRIDVGVWRRIKATERGYNEQWSHWWINAIKPGQLSSHEYRFTEWAVDAANREARNNIEDANR